MRFSPIEQEAIVLNAAWAMIDDMVNFAIFAPLGSRVHDTNLIPQTQETLRLFNILLTDFLSPLTQKSKGGLPFGLPTPPNNARSSDLTFLFYLKGVCANPQLNSEATAIAGPVEEFSNWLEARSVVEKAWFPSVELEVDLHVERREWIRICGDILKHSFPRLEANVAKITRILRDHGHEVDDGLAYAMLPEFSDWFHTHLFAYHASTIAEYLNNIRWGLFTYLKPEFSRSFHPIEPAPNYRFHVPEKIKHPFARSMYWEIMNRCRVHPYFPKFTVTQSLKQRY